MSKSRAFIAGGIGTVALLAAGTLPASAADGDTVTTFNVQGGTLSVAVAANANLPQVNTGAPEVSGQIGNVAVTDNRGSTNSWTVSAMSTTFTRTINSITTTSEGVVYNTGAIQKSGTVTTNTTPDQPLAIAPTPVVDGKWVVGSNTANWEATLTVDLPTSALTGQWSGTVTTSVA